MSIPKDRATMQAWLIANLEELRERLKHRFKDPADLEDAMQTGTLEAYARLDQFDPAVAFFWWVYRFVYHQGQSGERKEGRHRKVVATVEPEVLERHAGTTGDEDDGGEMSSLVKEGLSTLPLGQAQTVDKHYFQERSTSDIAVEESRAVGTIKRRLSDARENLRDNPHVIAAHELRRPRLRSKPDQQAGGEPVAAPATPASIDGDNDDRPQRPSRRKKP